MPSPKNLDTKVTDDVDEFLNNINPGDILLFDTMRLVSQLIKFAENRPVNHCGVFLGDDQFAQIGSGTPYAHVADLRKRLEDRPGPYDRTITALRHRDAFSGRESVDKGKAIVKVANLYIGKRKTSYSYIGLRHLMIPSLYRNYKSELQNNNLPVGVLPLIKLLAKAILSHYEKGESVRELTETRSLTCSEFVYRCYAEAEPRLPVEVHLPLMRWNMELWRLSQPRRSRRDRGNGDPNRVYFADPAGVAGLGAGENEILGPLLFDNSLQPGLLKVSRGEVPPQEWKFVTTPKGAVDSLSEEAYGMWQGDGYEFRGPLSQDSGEVDLAVWTNRMVRDLARHNGDRSKYEPESDSGLEAGEVFADSVTPRDLWSSRSLRPAAVFHCPPSRDDVPILE